MRLIYILFSIALISCALPPKDAEAANQHETDTTTSKVVCLTPMPADFKTGAEQMSQVLKHLDTKRVGVIANPTSQVKGTHLVDTLLSHGIKLQKIFCPEHGFRGEGAAGENIHNSVDSKTGISIISLHGKHKKPQQEDLQDVDILVFDIQDVGARFYTYISTLHYVMEAAAERQIPLLVLDRPNPNGYLIDGPVLQPEFSSFIGKHPIPISHGMTIAEYAQMINGEKWLEGGLTCTLEIIPCASYTHHMRYDLPVKPSPNLPSPVSVALYPSICLFEGTAVSIGRGTDYPFQVYGHPQLKDTSFIFTPTSRRAAPSPKLENKRCNGVLYTWPEAENMVCSGQLNLEPILTAYKELHDSTEFFTRPDFFDLLAGGSELREHITQGLSASEICAHWSDDLESFKKFRQQYLLYPEK